MGWNSPRRPGEMGESEEEAPVEQKSSSSAPRIPVVPGSLHLTIELIAAFPRLFWESYRDGKPKLSGQCF
jgi:hypothetical protein